MYAKASSKVVTENSQSHVFRCEKGVRQGCNLSPLLFSLFLSDLEHHLTTNDAGNTQLHNIKVNLLQFADDHVLLADSPTGLQHYLNLLYSYCSTWDLKINTDKTKIIVFHRRQADTNRYEFQLNNNPIEIVTMYKYLGIMLSENG